MIHHLELWVNDPETDIAEWGWLLCAIGWEPSEPWSGGRAWNSKSVYIVLTEAPALVPGSLNRRSAGMNHVALNVSTDQLLLEIFENCRDHGWAPLYDDRYPARGIEGQLTGYLESTSGWKAELVGPPTASSETPNGAITSDE